MNCPKCSSTRHNAQATNSRPVDQTVRKRQCQDCGACWFTVEVLVPDESVGWTAEHRKPVLREPVKVEAQGVARRRAGRPVTDCN